MAVNSTTIALDMLAPVLTLDDGITAAVTKADDTTTNVDLYSRNKDSKGWNGVCGISQGYRLSSGLTG